MANGRITQRPSSQPTILDIDIIRERVRQANQRRIERNRPRTANEEFFSQLPQGASSILEGAPAVAPSTAPAGPSAGPPAGFPSEFNLDRTAILDTFTGPVEPFSLPLPGPAAATSSGVAAPVGGGGDELTELARQKLMEQLQADRSQERSAFENLVEANVELPNSVLVAMLPGLLRDHAQVKARRRGATFDEVVGVLKAASEAEEIAQKTELMPAKLDISRMNAIASLLNTQGRDTEPHLKLRAKATRMGIPLTGLEQRVEADPTGPPAPERSLTPQQREIQKLVDKLKSFPTAERKRLFREARIGKSGASAVERVEREAASKASRQQVEKAIRAAGSTRERVDILLSEGGDLSTTERELMFTLIETLERTDAE